MNRQSRRSVATALAVIATIFIAAYSLSWAFRGNRTEHYSQLGDSWVFKENRNGPVIGDLGGVPVSIPRPYARFVEYDDDPHFLEKRKGPPPQRTHTSKLRAFGFEVRFPDMAADTGVAAEEKRKATIQNTMWLTVVIASHSTYGTDDEALERMVAAINDPSAHSYRYRPLPEKTYGLAGFTPIGADESRRGWGILVDGKAADMNDYNIYYHRDQSGRVDSYIECGNMKHAADTCAQEFHVLPAMRVRAKVRYRKELLPHWREIQSSVAKVVLGFRVAPNPATTQH